MALSAPPTERKRVKVYELRENDWHDRGTGFCNTQCILDKGHIYVESEETPDEVLLESKIKKEDSYQKQQDTLIVWTDNNGVDMALSFQEAEGCGLVCDAIGTVQQRPMEDSDDVPPGPLSLPPPAIGNLAQVEDVMRRANQTQMGRDSLAKMVVAEDYIQRLTPLVTEAEDLESLTDLHRLCSIMKMLILFNDTSIIEHIVKDEVIIGVVGALEYDPDFPNHKANHRQYLSDESKFKEVVPIEDQNIKDRIHYTYRLQYLKDVVLARILDDPTFNVLNSLIFFHQVDIVQHFSSNTSYLNKIFALINDSKAPAASRKDAVLLIQQSCAMAKNLQAPSRMALYENLINGGLFSIITFAVQHEDAAVRVAGTDILVALIDHSAAMARQHVFKSISEGTKPMTETLIDLLLVETDLGVKAQIADALKVLLDPNANGPGDDRPMGGDHGFMKLRSSPASSAQSDSFLSHFYEHSADKLFKPLADLGKRTDISKLTFQESTTFVHLIEILCFFMRQHAARGRIYILDRSFHQRVAQLLEQSPEKHLKIHAIKYFRTVITIGDEYHIRQLTHFDLIKPLLKVITSTMPRDNLLNSVCLELFEHIRREDVKHIIMHIGMSLMDIVSSIKITPVFQGIIERYERHLNPPPEGLNGDGTADSSFMTSDVETPNTRHITINGGGQRWQGLRDTDPDEEAYFNTSDDEDEEDELSADHPMPVTPEARTSRLTNGLGASPLSKPLVDYEEDDGDEELHASHGDAMDSDAQSSPLSNAGLISSDASRPSSATSPPSGQQTGTTSANPSRPPSAKRMREEEDEDDELSKLSQGFKRRTSSQNLRTLRDNASSPSAENSKSSPVSGADKAKSDHPDDMETDEKTSTTTKNTTPLRHSARRKERDSLNGKGAADSGRKTRISISLGKGKES